MTRAVCATVMNQQLNRLPFSFVVLAYVKDVEHEDIVRLRIEALLASDCEDLAQKLIKQCLTSDVFINNPGILLRRFKCLYKSGNLEEFHQLVKTVFL